MKPLFFALALTFATPALAGHAPTMIKLSTGSELATWTLPAEGGKPHKTPVVFLHGGPGMFTAANQFEHGAAFRKAGFTTLYFDQAGGRQSPKIPASGYTLARAVADLEALRVAKGADKFILWGSSYGAELAVLYASANPDRVAGFVLTSPGVYPGLKATRDYGKTARGKANLSKQLSAAASLVDKKGAAAETELSQDAASKLMDEFVQAEWAGAGQCKGAAAPAAITESGANLYANRMILKELKSAAAPALTADKVPALIVRGVCDYIPDASLAAYRKLLGGSFVAIAGSGHSLIENRVVVDAAFAAFADSQLAKVE